MFVRSRPEGGAVGFAQCDECERAQIAAYEGAGNFHAAGCAEGNVGGVAVAMSTTCGRMYSRAARRDARGSNAAITACGPEVRPLTSKRPWLSVYHEFDAYSPNITIIAPGCGLPSIVNVPRFAAIAEHDAVCGDVAPRGR